MEQTVDRLIKHLGIYRSIVGTTGISRPVTLHEARLDGAVIRNGWRRNYSGDGIPEGRLANFVGKKLTDETWIACIKRLQDWKIIDLVAGYHGDTRRVVLTAEGEYWALQLCGERQLAGMSPDGIEE